MQVIIGLGLTKGSQTEWDALHAGLTEKFNRKVKLPKIVDGKGVLIVHQVPANDQRQLSSPHETGELYGTSVPRKEPRYKKRLETPSIGSTLPNRYRTNEKKTRRLIKVDDDNLSWDGSVSSGIASPDGARSPVFPQDLSPTSDNFTLRRGYYNPSSPTRRSSGEYSPGRSSDDIFNLGDREQYPDYSRMILNTSRSYDMNEGHDDGGMDLHPAREDYPGYPKTTQNPMMEKPMFEEGSMDSGNATWYNSGESTMGDTGEYSTTAGPFGQKNTERPQMIQEYLHSVGRDTMVRNKHVASDNKNLYLKSKMNTNSNRGGNVRYKSRSVQDFNVADTPRNDAFKARSMYDLDDDEASTLSRPRDLFGTVAKISGFRPSLWSPGWGNQG
ncbi:uncharacterized protein [Apostichopus japonicus]|uniref:uncharacterized protein n=1 Tax=Stichopus japonicus TaxID=307972 RepID=UPI003AB22897